MAQFTVEIPMQLISRFQERGEQISEVIVKALEHYLETENAAIYQTHTWELSGSLEIAEPDPKYVIGRDEQGRIITNYAEKLDEVIY